MPDASFDSPAAVADPALDGKASRGRPLAVSGAVQLLMVLMGYVPLLHLLAIAACIALPLAGYAPKPWAFASLGVLYLLPPLACRFATCFSKPEGSFALGSRPFLAWWFQAQWQVIFNRLRFLEELLRMIPGFYSLWLRLWGSRIGKFVYWSPGVAVLDRGYLSIGDRVVFGAGVRMNPHVLTPDETGVTSLVLAPVSVGTGSLVGGYSLLAPGVRVGHGETLPALYAAPPHSEWKDSKRTHARRPVMTTGE